MRRMIPRPWVVLLAAGGSRRFGRSKQLARIGGESLLRRAARIALASSPPGCVVVLGAHAARLRLELVGLPLVVVRNSSWREGLAGSIRAGIAALPRGTHGALVLLADQVAVGPADLEMLIAAWRLAPRSLVAASASGIRCPPAIFPRSAFPDLLRLRGDIGARKLLRDASRRVIEFELPAAAVDVDRPEDLPRLKPARVPHRIPRSARSYPARPPKSSGGK